MHDWRVTAARLRAEADAPADVPLCVERTLTAHYPVAIVRLSGLRIAEIKAWLGRHRAVMPAALIACADRRLRGGLIACRGCGVLFIDAADPADEQSFTIAHEADHFVGDHLYPRLDLLQRLGPDILPVLDGRRPPTQAERVDALLARAPLAHHIHLLARDEPVRSDVQTSEADADSFAREILAPVAAIERHFGLSLRLLSASESEGRGSRLRPHCHEERSANTGVGTGSDCRQAPEVRPPCPPQDVVAAYIAGAFGLPARHADIHARTFVAERMQPTSLLHRLGLA